jgi:NADH-quinone oxidoreductase subunit M
MPGSANFTGEFYILLGVFQAKIVYAFVAAIGIALAAYYAIRLFQRTMHDRLPDGISAREISLRDAAVLVPVTACIVGLALYPGLITKRADSSVKSSVGAVTTAQAASSKQQAAAGTNKLLAASCSLPAARCEPKASP